MRSLCVLAVGVLGGQAIAGPVTFNFIDVGGEWGVFADDGVGFLNLPSQGMYSLVPGVVDLRYSEFDGIARSDATVAGSLVASTSPDGAMFAGQLDFGVFGEVAGDGSGGGLAIATVGLSSIFVSAQIDEPVILTIEGRPAIELMQGLGQLGEGQHELLPGNYAFELVGMGEYLEVSAVNGESASSFGSVGWSMQFAPVPAPGTWAAFGAAGGLMVRRRRR